MRPPWHSDHELTPDGLAAVLREQFPDDFPDPKVEPLPFGWDYLTFRVDDEWAFRVPKRRDVVPHMHQEFVLLEAMGALPVGVPQPRFHGRSDDIVPYPFYGYPFIHGTFADDPSVVPARVIPEVLAFLQALHALPAPVALDPRPHTPWPDRVEALRATVEDLPDLAPALPWLLRHHPQAEVAPVLLHNGLSPSTLLVDSESQALIAVLDWGDAALGDPAYDLLTLVLWDPTATATAFTSAGGSTETLRRAGVFALLTGLERLRHELRWDPPGARRRHTAVRAVLAHVAG